ncbi:hypothetical protein Tco_1011934 [Tanacetum coccineum]
MRMLILKPNLEKFNYCLTRDPSTNFSPMITIDPNPKKFTDEPAPACLPPPGDDESFIKEDVQKENFQVYSNPLFEFDDNYKLYFLLFEEGYYDSEGDVFYLESLLSDDITHNLSPEVFFDHEPQCFKDESELDTLENMVWIQQKSQENGQSRTNTDRRQKRMYKRDLIARKVKSQQQSTLGQPKSTH